MPKKKKQREKHVPIRMCIVTKERKPKMELMRLVRVGDEVLIDPKGKKRGRGANISLDMKIFDEAAKKHMIERALKLEKNLTADELSKLREEFEEAVEERKFRKGSKPVVMKIEKKRWKEIEQIETDGTDRRK